MLIRFGLISKNKHGKLQTRSKKKYASLRFQAKFCFRIKYLFSAPFLLIACLSIDTNLLLIKTKFHKLKTKKLNSRTEYKQAGILLPLEGLETRTMKRKLCFTYSPASILFKFTARPKLYATDHMSNPRSESTILIYCLVTLRLLRSRRLC